MQYVQIYFKMSTKNRCEMPDATARGYDTDGRMTDYSFMSQWYEIWTAFGPF